MTHRRAFIGFAGAALVAGRPVNTSAARKLGIALPGSLLSRADVVVP